MFLYRPAQHGCLARLRSLGLILEGSGGSFRDTPLSLHCMTSNLQSWTRQAVKSSCWGTVQLLAPIRLEPNTRPRACMQHILRDLLRRLCVRGGAQAAAMRAQVPPGVHRSLVPDLPGLLAACRMPHLQRAPVTAAVLVMPGIGNNCEQAIVPCSHVQRGASSLHPRPLAVRVAL